MEAPHEKDQASSLEKAEIHQSKDLSATSSDIVPLTRPAVPLTVDEVALKGHAATDRYGRPLVAIDKKAEAALARKIDVRIIPVVALL